MSDLIQRARAAVYRPLERSPALLEELANTLERQRLALRWYMDVMHFHMGCGPDCEAHHGDALEEIT
jgi:predicted transcriptional regulator